MTSNFCLQAFPLTPVPESINRPLWSVMIPTYNCEKYLRQTLISVLSQDPGPEKMQIEVIDDCSTEDDPETIIQEIGKGRVHFYRQSHNVGVPKNFETCLSRSHGYLIHILHGDDYVRDGFYQKMQHLFEQYPNIGAAFCRHIFMDDRGHWQAISDLEQSESGILENWLERLALEQRIMTPSMVVRREVYEKLGGFDRRLICAEDWEMWVRIAANYPIGYEVEPLAVYRIHTNSNTGRHIRTAEDMRYTRIAIDIFSTYLPPDISPHVTRQARQTYAQSALSMAKQTAKQGDRVATLKQLREAFALSRSWRLLPKALMVLLRLVVHSIGQREATVL